MSRRYALLLGGFLEERAILRLAASAKPDLDLCTTVDVSGNKLAATVSCPSSSAQYESKLFWKKMHGKNEFGVFPLCGIERKE